jgi:hypothetical protein
MYTKDHTHHVPTLALGGETLVFDRKRNMQVFRLDGAVVLPIGAEVELVEPNVNAKVVGIRLLAGRPATPADEGYPMVVCLDVEVPETWWNSEDEI